MSISQYGALNTTALITPDLHVIITPPSQLTIKGVSTNIVAFVGTASWGPVNLASIVSSMADYASGFGPVMPRKFDIGTHIAAAVLQGANNFRCVRVTDGTDVNASFVLTSPDLAAAPVFWAAVEAALNSGAGVLRNASSLVTFDASTGTFAAVYSGSLGSLIKVTVSRGSKSGTYRIVVGLAGGRPEVFDNLPSTTGAVPLLLTHALAGGTDGASGVTAQTLVGVDTLPRSGMYALRGQKVSLVDLCDCDDSTTYTTQAAFGYSEQCYMIAVTPSGDTIANAIATKATAGLDDWPVKLMFGDFLWFEDAANQVVRLISPQGFAIGRLGNLSPEQSSLNKPLYGIVGSQKSGQPGGVAQSTYATADTDALIGAGIDLICNPVPYGNVWAVRGGCNTSSDAGINGDEYTRLTNFFSTSINATEGKHVGGTINLTLLNSVKFELINFFTLCLSQGILGSVDGSIPFAVQCDARNNPQIATGQGYTQAYAQVQYQGINKNFLINLQAGSTQVISQAA